MNYSYTPERTFFFPHNGNFIENTILSNYKNDGKKFHKSFNNHNITYNLTSSYNYDNKTPLIKQNNNLNLSYFKRKNNNKSPCFCVCHKNERSFPLSEYNYNQNPCITEYNKTVSCKNNDYLPKYNVNLLSKVNNLKENLIIFEDKLNKAKYEKNISDIYIKRLENELSSSNMNNSFNNLKHNKIENNPIKLRDYDRYRNILNQKLEILDSISDKKNEPKGKASREVKDFNYIIESQKKWLDTLYQNHSHNNFYNNFNYNNYNSENINQNDIRNNDNILGNNNYLYENKSNNYNFNYSNNFSDINNQNYINKNKSYNDIFNSIPKNDINTNPNYNFKTVICNDINIKKDLENSNKSNNIFYPIYPSNPTINKESQYQNKNKNNYPISIHKNIQKNNIINNSPKFSNSTNFLPSQNQQNYKTYQYQTDQNLNNKNNNNQNFQKDQNLNNKNNNNQNFQNIENNIKNEIIKMNNLDQRYLILDSQGNPIYIKGKKLLGMKVTKFKDDGKEVLDKKGNIIFLGSDGEVITQENLKPILLDNSKYLVNEENKPFLGFGDKFMVNEEGNPIFGQNEVKGEVGILPRDNKGDFIKINLTKNNNNINKNINNTNLNNNDKEKKKFNNLNLKDYLTKNINGKKNGYNSRNNINLNKTMNFTFDKNIKKNNYYPDIIKNKKKFDKILLKNKFKNRINYKPFKSVKNNEKEYLNSSCFACDVGCGVSRTGYSPMTYSPFNKRVKRKDETQLKKETKYQQYNKYKK